MPDIYHTNRRQLYILPTKVGWILGFIIFALLIASIKYNHQGTFLLTFLLASIGQVSSLYTHKNLLKIGLSATHAKPVFAGEPAEFPVTINNPSNTKKHAIWLLFENHSEHFSLHAQQSKNVMCKVATQQRGQLIIPDIILSSHFPIGILFSWTKTFSASAHCIIYPKPKKILVTPNLATNNYSYNKNSSTSKQPGNDDFSTLKPYQPGDRLRDIHWPSFAKNQQLVSKQFTSTAIHSRLFNWGQVKTLNTEDKLSQLTYWINETEKKQQKYQLSIPGFTSPLDSGPAHRHQCLSALANWSGKNESV